MRIGLTAPYRWAESDRTLEARAAYADVLLDRATAYLDSSLEDVDVVDNKALQLTVGDVAAFTILVTFRHSWIWTVPEVLLASAALLFFNAYRPRDWEIGPDLETFNPPDKPDRPAEGPEIKMAMADEVLWAANENRRRIRGKLRSFRYGLWILGLGFLLSFGLAIADR